MPSTFKAVDESSSVDSRQQLATQAKIGYQAEERAKLIREIEIENSENVRIVGINSLGR